MRLVERKSKRLGSHCMHAPGGTYEQAMPAHGEGLNGLFPARSLKLESWICTAPGCLYPKIAANLVAIVPLAPSFAACERCMKCTTTWLKRPRAMGTRLKSCWWMLSTVLLYCGYHPRTPGGRSSPVKG